MDILCSLYVEGNLVVVGEITARRETQKQAEKSPGKSSPIGSASDWEGGLGDGLINEASL